MRRVLVPLDGTPQAASILPDARDLAGDDGELILIRDPVGSASGGAIRGRTAGEAVSDTLADLNGVAEQLRQTGLKVEAYALVAIDPAYAIDEAARAYGADIIACATHGRGPLGRLVRGGIVWRALADSPVPVLVRHRDASRPARPIFEPENRILVPLDGSELAERALPLAQELARERDAPIWLVHVVSSYPITGFARTAVDPEAVTEARAGQQARRYLDEVAARLSGAVHKHVLFGSVSEHLIAAVKAWDISHVVMTSHGRTGLPRVVLGSVADDLIHHLSSPIVVIPLHALKAVETPGDTAAATNTR